MKVVFECEKCGYVLKEYEPVVDKFFVSQRESDWPCPVCAKLTYGPLTEELVAEALAIVFASVEEPETDPDTVWERAAQYGYRSEARFVLRLLKEFGPPMLASWSPGGSTRELLLKLARDS